MNKLLILSLLVAFSFATQYVPIPNTYDGITVGSPTARLHIEAFYDLLCPDSKVSNEAFRTVFQNVDLTKIQFTYHIFPLPYHINAFLAGQGLRYVYDVKGLQATVDYINWFFDNQDNWSGAATWNTPQNQVVNELAASVASALSQHEIDVTKLTAALQNGNNYNQETRVSWKYACSRGITGTPIFLVNGVVLDGAESWSADSWTTFINLRTKSHIRHPQ